MVKPGAKPNVATGSDPPAAERFVHHRPDDHETEAVHHDDDIIDHDHDHDRPVNDRDGALRVASVSQFRLSAPLPAHLLAAGSRTALTVIRRGHVAPGCAADAGWTVHGKGGCGT